MNFSELMRVGGLLGLATVKYATQGQFLVDWGILEIFKTYDKPEDQGDRLAAKTLFMPEFMGRRFKTLLQAKGFEPEELQRFCKYQPFRIILQSLPNLLSGLLTRGFLKGSVIDVKTNRDKIVKTATELFRFYGYNGTSIDKLIKAAGVSKSNFYYYFESKEELGLEVLGNILREEEERISEILLNADMNPLERIVKFFEAAIYSKRELFLESGSFFAKMALEQGSINEKFRSIVEIYFQKVVAAFEVCVEECKELGIIYEGVNTKLLPKFLVSQVKGAIIMAKVYNSYEPIREAYEGAKNLIVKEEWQHLVPEFD